MIDPKKVRAQCIAKPNEENRFKEDRIRISNNLYAIADGAGGQGVFAADWAEYLLKNLPNEPIRSKDEFFNWYSIVRLPFYEEKLKFIRREIPDLLTKFKREGSLSTLLVMWYVEVENKTYMLSCGDSTLFLKTKKFWSSMGSYSNFMNSPSLLNCTKDYPESDILLRSDSYFKSGRYFLCSDSLAQYILASFLFTHATEKNIEELKIVEDEYLRLSQYTIDLRKAGFSNKNFQKDILKPLRRCLKSEEEFREYLYQLNKNKVLNYDDYSLIIIN